MTLFWISIIRHAMQRDKENDSQINDKTTNIKGTEKDFGKFCELHPELTDSKLFAQYPFSFFYRFLFLFFYSFFFSFNFFI